MSDERQGWFSGLLTDLLVWTMAFAMLLALTLAFPLIILMNLVRRLGGRKPLWKPSETKVVQIPRRFSMGTDDFRRN